MEQQAQPQPDVIVYRLTSGYLVHLGNGNSVACSNEAMLGRAIRNYFMGDPPLKVRQPSKSPPTAQEAAVAEGVTPPSREPVPIHRAPPREQTMAAGEPNKLVVQENLMRLCESYAAGKINPEQWLAGLNKYCPGITLREAKLTLASYTGVPEPPANRAQPERDEVDHYKMAPEIDKPWDQHDQQTVMDLVEGVPSAQQILDTEAILEIVPAEESEILEDGMKLIPSDTPEWMQQPL